MSLNILDYPYLSQWDSTTCKNTNCRPTADAMIAWYYLDQPVHPQDIRAAMGYGASCAGTFPQDGVKALNSFGVPSNMGILGASVIKDKLNQGIPIDISIMYGYISSRQDKACTGAHSVLAIKADTVNGVSGIRVRDPDHWASGIKDNEFWPDSQWIAGFYACANTNYGGYAVFPINPKIETTPPPVLPVLTILGEGNMLKTIVPIRAIDTRKNQGLSGPLKGHAINFVNVLQVLGLTATDNVTAIILNITVTDTTLGGNWAYVGPGTVTPVTSTINWASAGQILANGAVVGLNPDGTLLVYACSATHMIIDITGYVTNSAV